jgi:hypothetical protein
MALDLRLEHDLDVCLHTQVVSYGISINLVEVTWKSKIKQQFPNPNDYSAFMGDFSSATGACSCSFHVQQSDLLSQNLCPTPMQLFRLSLAIIACKLTTSVVNNPPGLSAVPRSGVSRALLLSDPLKSWPPGGRVSDAAWLTRGGGCGAGAVTFIMMLLSRFIFRKYGWGVAALITPTVLLITGVAFFGLVLFSAPLDPLLTKLALTPLMAAVLVGAAQNVFSKSSKYSLFDPCKEMAYIPLDQETQLKVGRTYPYRALVIPAAHVLAASVHTTGARPLPLRQFRQSTLCPVVRMSVRTLPICTLSFHQFGVF